MDCLSEQALLQNAVNKICMLLSCIKPREDFHLVNDFSIFFRLFALKLLDLLQVKQTTLDDKLFAPDSLI